MRMYKLKRLLALGVSALLFASNTFSVSAITAQPGYSIASNEIDYNVNETQVVTVENVPLITTEVQQISTSFQTTEDKQVEKLADTSTDKSVYETVEPKESAESTKKSIQSVAAQTKVEAVGAGATQATTVRYDLYDVYNSNKKTWRTSYVTYCYYTSGTKNSKYRYPNGKNNGKDWYSGKVAQIVLVVGDTKCTWTCDESTLQGDGGVDQGTGTLTVTRTTTNESALPSYYFGTLNNRKGESIEQVWAPWNGMRRNAADTAWVTALPHSKVKDIKFTNTRSISDYAFYGFNRTNGNLDSIYFTTKTVSVGKYAFRSSGVNGITSWGSISSLGVGAFSNCDYLQTVNFDNNKNISFAAPSTSVDHGVGYDYGVFQGCDKLGTIDFGSGITTVNTKAFYDCDTINTIRWGNVNTIKAYAFGGCDGFRNGLSINGNKIEILEKRAFYNCDGNFTILSFSAPKLTTIGGSVEYESGGGGAFANCDSLVTVNLGSYIKVIGKQAFYNDDALKRINFGTCLLDKIDEEAFFSCDSLCQGTVNGGIGNATKTLIDKLTNSGSTGLDYNTSSENFNVFTVPTTIGTIGQGAFRKCTALRSFTWTQPSTAGDGTIKLKIIESNTFYNDPAFQLFVVPDGLTEIKGNEGNNQNYGAFQLDGEFSKNQVGYTFWLAISNNTSNLTKIGNKAFMRGNAYSTGKGVRLLYRNTDRTASNIQVKASDVFIFPKLTYVGERAFIHNPAFTGIIQFGTPASPAYAAIGHRAFSDTNLTDLFFKWNPNQRVSVNNRLSSTIGSSNEYVSVSDARGYTDTTYLSKCPSGFSSLYSVLHNSSNGLFKLWENVFKNIVLGNNDFYSWKADIGNDKATQPESVPELSYGKSNNNIMKDKVANINTSTYLKTSAKWITKNKLAEETVSFGYKNRTKVDFVFVVDNSPSMDMAAGDNGNSYRGTYNASKTMNEYSQIYNISKRVLSGTNGSSVSIVSFNGNNNNELSNSSKLLGSVGMTDSDSVYNALFKNDDGYEDGGVTNYSAGLSRAYSVLAELQKKETGNKQIVLFLTDGSPTYCDANGSAVSVTASKADTSLSKLVDGEDWSKAIRETGTVTVHNADKACSSTPNITTTVTGLNVPIYGILVGSETNYKQINIVTSGDAGNRDNTKTSTNIKELGSSLSSIIESAFSEDYVITVPLNDNFVLDESSSMEVDIIEQENTSPHTVFGRFTDAMEGIFIYNKNISSTYGQIKYDSDRNCIIWDLSTHPNTDLTSTPYQTYTLKFVLKCVGTGRKVNNVKDTNGVSYDYYAVNDNDSNTSRNNSTSSDSVIGKSFISSITGKDEGNKYGAYVYLSKGQKANVSTMNLDDSKLGVTDIQTPTELTDNLMSVAPSIYLPYYTGTLNLDKYDDNGTKLGGAEFKMFDEDLKLVKFVSQSPGYFIYNSTASTTSVSTYSDKSTVVFAVPYGTYYILESKYPTSSVCTYVDSQKNSYVTDKIPEGYTTKQNLIKFEVNDQTVDLPVYNTSISTIGKITGTKYYMDGRNSGSVTALNGAVMALYKSFGDAQNKNNNYLATAVTNSTGDYSFSVSEIGTYYVREIQAPNGFQMSEAIQSVTVSELNGTSSHVQTIYDFILAKITVHVNSSDNVKEKFNFTLVGDGSDTGASSVEYTGISNSDGTYTFEVPLYHVYTPYPGSKPVYHGISYTLKETGYNGGKIPSRYIYQEYGLNSFDNTVKQESYSIQYEDWDGTPYAYSPAYTAPDYDIYVYNPSIRVTLYNYDGTDKTTPLQSTFVFNGTRITTDENGFAEYTAWLGYSKSSIDQIKVPEGYNLLSERINFTIDSSTELTTLYNETTGNKYFNCSVTIYNTPKNELPFTGGNSYFWLMFSGVFLLCFGCLISVLYKYYKNKHYKKHNKSPSRSS